MTRKRGTGVVLVGKAAPPSSSWWIVPDAEFHDAAAAQWPRMAGSKMSIFVENTHAHPATTSRSADVIARLHRNDT